MASGTSTIAKTSIITLGVIQMLLGLCLIINNYSLSFVVPILIASGIVTTILGIVLHKCKIIPYIFGLLVLIGIGLIASTYCRKIFFRLHP